jgi:hypothetical protein
MPPQPHKNRRLTTTFPRSCKWKADAFAGILGQLRGLGGLAVLVNCPASKLRRKSCDSLASAGSSGVSIRIRRLRKVQRDCGLACFDQNTQTLRIGLQRGMAVFLDTEGKLRVGMRIA